MDVVSVTGFGGGPAQKRDEKVHTQCLQNQGKRTSRLRGIAGKQRGENTFSDPNKRRKTWKLKVWGGRRNQIGYLQDGRGH